MTNLLKFDILFSTAKRAAVVAKLVLLGILSSIFLILTLYTCFLKTSFLTKSLNLLKSTGIGTNLSESNLSTFQIV